jgi:hypothetical protein
VDIIQVTTVSSSLLVDIIQVTTVSSSLLVDIIQVTTAGDVNVPGVELGFSQLRLGNNRFRSLVGCVREERPAQGDAASADPSAATGS